jgi:hypothetical protein
MHYGKRSFFCFKEHGRVHGCREWFAMADEADPIKTLTNARDKLIDERRGLAVAIALGYRRRRSDDPLTNETRTAFIDVQNLIEAMERAMAHELTIGKDRPLATSVANLGNAPPIAAGFDGRA